MKKMLVYTVLGMLFVSSLAGCGSLSGSNTGVNNSSADSTSAGIIQTDAGGADAGEDTDSSLLTTYDMLDFEDMFSDRDKDASYDESSATQITLSDSKAEVTGNGATANGTTVTISTEGTYIISGSAKDAEIIIDADDKDKVQLVLDNCNITNDDSACILVNKADKVFLTLADDSENTLSDTDEEYTQSTDDYTVSGVIFSRSDITFNGSGSLTINAGYKHGIVCKDDLKVTGGSYQITSAEKGIAANDSIRIADASFTIDAGNDALHTSNGDDEGKGYLYIAGGTFDIKSDDDAIHAKTCLVITGGDINIEESYEGLEGATIDIEGGDIDVMASDDGINAAYKRSDSVDTADEQEKHQEASSDMDANVPTETEMNTSTQANETYYTGNDSETSVQNTLTAEKIGNHANMVGNANMGGGHNGMDGGPGGGMMDTQADAYIKVSGGDVYVNADGDGVDSNGMIYVTGGTLTVEGPTNSANAALDYGIGAEISGGTAIFAGSVGMAENFDENSTQYSVLYNFDSVISAGTEVSLLDESGQKLMTFTPCKEYQSVIFSCAELKEGSYTIKAGDTEEEITVNSVSSSNGAGGMGRRS